LLEGEVGYVTDNPNQYKIGDGVHAWNDLPLRGYTGTISQEFGDDENSVVSQKTITEKLTELEIRTIVTELYCQKTVPNINNVSYIRLVNGNQYKQIFLKDNEGNNIDAISLTEDGTIPNGLYKGKNTDVFRKFFSKMVSVFLHIFDISLCGHQGICRLFIR
jgi:hypothetical protein